MTVEDEAVDLAGFLSRERVEVEAALQRALERHLHGVPETLAAPIRHGVTTGGKRLRPILFATAFRACGGVGEGIYDLAIPLEWIHAYSLMHDDLPCMDDAPLRRGRPTPHTVHGEEATLLGGAALIPLAALALRWAGREQGLPGARIDELVVLLARAAGGIGMVGGQALDLTAEGQALDRGSLDDLHRRKTGALLAAALEMGAVAADAPEGVRAGLLRYGREIGLAFQIADDILDRTASVEALGKEPSDTELEKSTYPALLGVEGARREARSRIEAAMDALHSVGIDSPELVALARYIVERGR